MEKTLFTWANFDEQDMLAYSFYDCTLNRDIGDFKKFQKISSIFLNYGHGIMEFYNDEGTKVIAAFKLELMVVS